MIIKDIKAREILDSRGNPTVEVDTILKNGVTGRFSVPSGASTGSMEAVEKRDITDRYLKMGVKSVVDSINNDLKHEIIGLDSKNQKKIDNILIKKDGTKNKSKYGANAILAISMSVLKATARNKGLSLYEYVGEEHILPRIMVNILNGGKHADNNLEIQEFMIIPVAKNIKDQIRMATEVFHTLKRILKEKGYSTNVGDEGGFAPNLNSNEEALDLIIESIKKANYTPAKDIYIGLDCAASEYYDGQNYKINNQSLSNLELIKYYKKLINKYPIISIEDPFYENDCEGFKKFTSDVGKEIQIVGDDLFVTNKTLLKKGIKDNLANAILLKPNQIGTYSEMIETIKLAEKNNIKTIISHRSGETEDTTIADLAVGLNLGQIKCGSMSRTDRVAKYNRLIRIEENINQ